MKISNIFSIKSLVDKIPPQAVSWVLTFAILLSIAGFYFTIRLISDDIRASRKNDQAVQKKLLYNDSIQYVVLKDLLTGQGFQDLKLKTISDHINKIEQNDGVLLKEIRQIDEIRQIISPFQFFMQKDDSTEKKLTDKITPKLHNQPIIKSPNEIKWRKKR